MRQLVELDAPSSFRDGGGAPERGRVQGDRVVRRLLVPHEAIVRVVGGGGADGHGLAPGAAVAVGHAPVAHAVSAVGRHLAGVALHMRAGASAWALRHERRPFSLPL